MILNVLGHLDPTFLMSHTQTQMGIDRLGASSAGVPREACRLRESSQCGNRQLSNPNRGMLGIATSMWPGGDLLLVQRVEAQH